MRAPYENGILMITAVCLLLCGCVQAPLKVTPIAKTEHPAALVDTLGQKIAAAGKAQADMLSPTWFAKAQASHAKAQAGLEKGIKLSTILDRIATGNAQLEQALKYTLKSTAEMPGVIKSRDAAIVAGAGKYPKAFARIEADFFKLTRAVETGNTPYITRRKKGVDDRYRALELQAIKAAALGDVRRRIEKARALEMDVLVPKSYLIAQSKLDDADRSITRNRYDNATIAKKVDIATFYCDRMVQIGRTASRFRENTTEDIILWMENQLSGINAALGGPDSRDVSFEAQQAAISDAIASLKRNRSSLTNLVEAKNMEIKRLNQRVSHLEGRTYQERIDKERLAADKARLTADARRLDAERERLAAEKRFNQLYTQVQGYFSADQAEVYKQSRQLVIRLKAMQFSVGRADIQPDNYPLLTTVQNAIVAFGQPEVTVEGHTDSTGSELMNQELSQVRAEAVRQYLIDNGTLSAGKITATGFGSSRPLASNATVAGRAVNRRIDVIIHPSME
jgi:OOP family OmpA-OmpF porin